MPVHAPNARTLRPAGQAPGANSPEEAARNLLPNADTTLSAIGGLALGMRRYPLWTAVAVSLAAEGVQQLGVRVAPHAFPARTRSIALKSAIDIGVAVSMWWVGHKLCGSEPTLARANPSAGDQAAEEVRAAGIGRGR